MASLRETNNLKWYGNEVVALVQETTRKGLRRGIQPVARSAKARCPVGTVERGTQKTGNARGMYWTERKPGALKKSIRSRVSKGKKLSAQVIAGDVQKIKGEKEVYYARFVEFGTSRTLAQPFLRPALDAHFGDVMAALQDSMP